jgi:hypothetical protein
MQENRKHKEVLNEGEIRSFDYIKEQIDYTIASCVTSSKKEVQEAYDIRNGQMPLEEYKYLKEGEGIEMPSDVRHIPVLKSMFDVLQGDEALQPIPWRITCNDSESIEKMLKERHAEFMKELDRILSQGVSRLVSEVNRNRKDLSPITSKANHTDFAKKQQDYKHYQTYLEIYSQKVMDNELNANDMKFRFNVMFNDLITSGMEFYQSKVVNIDLPPLFRELNPKGLFYVKGSNTHFIKDCSRAVYVEEIPAVEAYARWGHLFTAEDRKEFFQTYAKGVSENDIKLIHSEDGNVEGPFTSNSIKLLSESMVKIYSVEWKENTKIESSIDEEIVVNSKKKRVKDKMTKYRLDRYEGIRIGEKIYVEYGKSKYVIRSSRKPWDVPLTFNGMCYNDRNGKPFSIVMATKQLAMKIDIMHYFLENLVAVSGTKVIPVSFPDIPTWLDETNPVNRVKKWLSHVKNGAMLVDYSQDGAGKFNNYSTYDMSISTSVGIIEKIIILLEETASKITGVPRHRLGQMLQKDGKGVTENAIEQSTVVTQPMLLLHNTVMKMALSDHLNHCRMAYKKGYPGLYGMGSYGKAIYSKAHEDFTLADFDVHISDSSEVIKAIEEVKELSKELAIAKNVDASFLFDLIGNKSLTHVKELAKQAFESGKESELENLSNQLNEANNQLQQYYAELERLKQTDAEMKSKEIQLKETELQDRSKLEWAKRNDDKVFKSEDLANDKKRIQLEHLQLAYEPSAREIKDN